MFKTCSFIYLILVYLSLNFELMQSLNNEPEERIPEFAFDKSDFPGIFFNIQWSSVNPDERKNAKMVVCGNESVFWFYNTVAYENTEAGTRQHNIEIENCIIKMNDTTTMTLYQMTTTQFPSEFWIERVVFGFVGRRHYNYWMLHKLYVFALLQNGTQNELYVESEQFLKEIPYGYGCVTFSAAAKSSDNIGVVSFGLNGSVQMEPADKPGLRQVAKPSSVATLQTSTLKPRSRRTGAIKATTAKEKDTSLTDLLSVSIFIFSILAFLIVIRCCHLMLILFSRPSRPYHLLPVSLKRKVHY